MTLTVHRQSYNSLPDDKDQPEVAKEVLDQLKVLLLKHNVQEKFGYHLIHGHLKVVEGRVMFGKPMETLPGCYTRPTKVTQLDTVGIHGHIFVLNKNAQFVAYEYRQGPIPEIDENDNAFLAEVQGFLVERGLETLVGIQVLNGDKGRQLREFVLAENYGAIMLDAADANITEVYCITGWSTQTEHESVELKGNESHAATTKGTHQVFVDGKGLPDLDEDTVVNALRNAGIIN